MESKQQITGEIKKEIEKNDNKTSQSQTSGIH